MAYIQVEASVRTHRKFLKAGPAASWLWLCGMGYCQDGLTDGFIPFEAIDYLGVKGTTARKLKCTLVAVGLWEDVPGGWLVHDYLRHNKPASEVERIKRVRKAGGIKGGRPHKEETLPETLEVTDKVIDKVNLHENPSHLISSQRDSATATATSEARGQSVPLIARRRLNAAFEGPRVYVIQSQHQTFLGLRNHPDAERELFTWYERVSDEWTEGRRKSENPGTDMFKFWDARFNEEWPPTVAAKPPARHVPNWVKEARNV